MQATTAVTSTAVRNDWGDQHSLRAPQPTPLSAALSTRAVTAIDANERTGLRSTSAAADAASKPTISIDMYRAALKRRRRWTDSFWADYGFYVANSHDVLSIATHHPKHPVTTATRCATLLAMLAFSIGLS